MRSLVKSFWKKLVVIWKTEYAANLRITGSGVAVTSIVTLVTSPILSRIFDPTDYGIFGLYTNTLTNLHLLAGLMLPAAIVVERNRFRLYKLLSTLKYFVLGTALLVLALVVLLKPQLQQLFNDPSGGWWLWLLPIGLVFGKISEVTARLNVRNKAFRINAKVGVSSSLINRLGAVVGGLVKPSGWMLIGTSLLSVLPTLYLQQKEELRKVWRIPMKRKFCTAVLAHYRKYPLFMLPANLLSTLGHSAPFFLLSSSVSPSVAGAYLLAESMLLFPYRLVQATVRPVYLQKITAIIREDQLKFIQITQHTNWLLFLVGLLPFSLLTVFGVEIFTTVFGAKWEFSGVVVQYMAFFVLFRMSISPLSGIYQALGQEQYTLLMQAVLFICRVLPFTIGLYLFSLETALLLFAAGSLVGYLLYYYQLTRVSGLPYFAVIAQQLTLFTVVTFVFWSLKML